MSRVYLDHNATTPLRAEARAAMHAAMDVVGNPSSVHAEGRAAKGMVETARAQVAALIGCLPSQVVFTGSATEAAAMAVVQKQRHGGLFAAPPTEHGCLAVWSDVTVGGVHDREGRVHARALARLAEALHGAADAAGKDRGLIAVSGANSETGILWGDGRVPGRGLAEELSQGDAPVGVVADITQLAGKMPIRFEAKKPDYLILSAHKLGGPKGVGAFVNFTADDPLPLLRGGGQEMNRRSGTENLIGIAGFGAAAEAAARDVAQGRWAEIEEFRNILERALEDPSKNTIFVGNRVGRLPNTSCILTPGWKGETQVMQMDLAGFAISAGAACSSGKVRASAVLLAMGFDEAEATSAIRVSLGLDTTREDILRFADAWTAKRKKHEQRAA